MLRRFFSFLIQAAVKGSRSTSHIDVDNTGISLGFLDVLAGSRSWCCRVHQTLVREGRSFWHHLLCYWYQ